MRVSSLKIENFRGIRDGFVRFNKHAVLIGDNNAGTLPGVVTINNLHSFINTDNGWRRVEAALGAAVRAAYLEQHSGK